MTSIIIYARLSASATLGVNAGSISHAGGGATTQSVSVSGSVAEPGGEESWVATSGVNTKGAINTGQSFSGKSGVWINEFHYDTDSTDVGEFVEVVVGPDVAAALSSIVLNLYNGSGGASYATHALSTFLQGSTVTAIEFSTKISPKSKTAHRMDLVFPSAAPLFSSFPTRALLPQPQARPTV